MNGRMSAASSALLYRAVEASNQSMRGRRKLLPAVIPWIVGCLICSADPYADLDSVPAHVSLSVLLVEQCVDEYPRVARLGNEPSRVVYASHCVRCSDVRIDERKS